MGGRRGYAIAPMTLPPTPHAASPVAVPAHLGWRLLAMVYDALPLLAIWFFTSVIVLAVRGGVPVVPGSAAALAELLLLWLLSGLYVVGSWRRGGQTIGMRPWRLQVTAADGRPATLRALGLRYVVATLSLLAAGLGFFWALLDPERRAWHDRASATVLVRTQP